MAGEIADVASGGTIQSAWGNQVKNRSVQRYASTAERTSLVPSPSEGDVAYMEDSNELYIYTGSAWSKMAPSDLTAGGGITITGTDPDNTIAHADTSSQASVNNSGETTIQDVTIDTYGHVTALGSATLYRARYDYDTYTGGANIGTGLTPLSKSFVIPAAGLFIMNWSATVERTGASLFDGTLTVIPRDDGANLTTDQRLSDIRIDPLFPDNGDTFYFSGSAHKYFSGANTSTWSLFMSKGGSTTYDCATAQMSLMWLPSAG